MKNKSMPAIVGVIVVAILVIGGIAIFHKSSNKTSTTSTSSSSTSKASTPTTASSTSPIVQTKTASNVGQYLADNKGRALYTYGADTQGVSNCAGSCLAVWPVYQAAESSAAALPTNVSIISRSDGTKQYAYKGLPLYTFSSDSAGQVTGDGVSSFHVAKP